MALHSVLGVDRGMSLTAEQDALLLQLSDFDARSYDSLCLTELDPAVPLGPGRDADLGFRQAAARHIGEVFTRLSLAPQRLKFDLQVREELLQHAVAALTRPSGEQR